MRGDLCPYDHGTDRIVLDDRAMKGQFSGNAPGTVPSNMGRPPFFGAPSNNFGKAIEHENMRKRIPKVANI
jgi:hypothetical protein